MYQDTSLRAVDPEQYPEISRECEYGFVDQKAVAVSLIFGHFKNYFGEFAASLVILRGRGGGGGSARLYSRR